MLGPCLSDWGKARVIGRSAGVIGRSTRVIGRSTRVVGSCCTLSDLTIWCNKEVFTPRYFFQDTITEVF